MSPGGRGPVGTWARLDHLGQPARATFGHPVAIFLVVAGVALLIYSIVAGAGAGGPPWWGLFILALVVEFVGILMLPGFFTLQPNEARVLIVPGTATVSSANPPPCPLARPGRPPSVVRIPRLVRFSSLAPGVLHP